MGQKGTKSTSNPGKQYKISSILNDEEGTVVLDGKESKICLSDGTVLGLANVCKLYERSYELAHGPITPREDEEEDDFVGTKGRLSFRRKKSVKGRRKELRNDERKCLEMIERLFMLLLKTKKRRRELVNLSYEPMAQLLGSDNLLVSDEFTLFLLVGAWADNRIEVKGLERTLLSSSQEVDKTEKDEGKNDEKESECEEGGKESFGSDSPVIENHVDGESKSTLLVKSLHQLY